MGNTYLTTYLRHMDTPAPDSQANMADESDRPFSTLLSSNRNPIMMDEMTDMDTDEHVSKKQRMNIGARSESTAEPDLWQPLHYASDPREDTWSEVDRAEVQNSSSLTYQVPLSGEPRATQLPLCSTALISTHPTQLDGHDTNSTYPTGINTTANTTASIQMAPSIRKRSYRAKPSAARKCLKADTAIPPDGNANSLVLPEVPDHDYDFQALLAGYPRDVNFTAVEIIVFLPRLFFNEQIALRFASNNIQNPEHVKILKRHRRILVSTITIGSHYRAALQPYHFVDGEEDSTGKTWSRKQHKVPPNWNHKSLAINDFVPDRILRNRSNVAAPRSVPFGSLANNVIQWPEGDDTADLTRAVRFVCDKQEEAQTVLGHEPMFPDDLAWVLRHVGHAAINLSCEDSKIARRYKNMELGDLPDTSSSGGYTPNTVFTQSGTKSNLNSSVSPAEMGPPKDGEGFGPQDLSMLFMPWLNPQAQSSYLGSKQTSYTYGSPEAAAITLNGLNYRPPTPRLTSSPYGPPQSSFDYGSPDPMAMSSDGYNCHASASRSQSFDHRPYQHPSFNFGLTGSPLGTLAGPTTTAPDPLDHKPPSTHRPLHAASAVPPPQSPFHPHTPLFTTPSQTSPVSPLSSTPQPDFSSSAAFLPLHAIDLSFPPPHPSIPVETFQAAIRFALRPDQLSVPWTCSMDHIKSIMEVLRREDEQLKQLVEWNEMWVAEGERQKEMDEGVEALVGEEVREGVEAKSGGDRDWLVGYGGGADGAIYTNAWDHGVEINGVNGADGAVDAHDGGDAMNTGDTNDGEGADYAGDAEETDGADDVDA